MDQQPGFPHTKHFFKARKCDELSWFLRIRQRSTKLAVDSTDVMIVPLVMKVASEAWRSEITPWTVSAGLCYPSWQAFTSFIAFKISFLKMISIRYFWIKDVWMSKSLLLSSSRQVEGLLSAYDDMIAVSFRNFQSQMSARGRSGVRKRDLTAIWSSMSERSFCFRNSKWNFWACSDSII